MLATSEKMVNYARLTERADVLKVANKQTEKRSKVRFICQS